jgi:hypothetical protein
MVIFESKFYFKQGTRVHRFEVLGESPDHILNSSKVWKEKKLYPDSNWTWIRPPNLFLYRFWSLGCFLFFLSSSFLMWV